MATATDEVGQAEKNKEEWPQKSTKIAKRRKEILTE
jgi:hypothetical protein